MTRFPLWFLNLMITVLLGAGFCQKPAMGIQKRKVVAVEFGRMTIPKDGQCITYTGYLINDFFFDIEVRRNKHSVEFWKNSTPVTNFPTITSVLLHVIKGSCDPRIVQLGPSLDHSHISGLKFKVSWLKGEKGEEVLQSKDATEHFSPPPAWQESERAWGQYEITVPSEGISVSDTLRVCIVEADKQQACLKGDLENSVWIHDEIP